jgi:hypothetical protein
MASMVIGECIGGNDETTQLDDDLAGSGSRDGSGPDL